MATAAVANSSVDISGNTTFIDNSATRHGGGICAMLDSNGNISGSTAFIGNKASGSGGGIYSESNSNVSIRETPYSVVTQLVVIVEEFVQGPVAM